VVSGEGVGIRRRCSTSGRAGESREIKSHLRHEWGLKASARGEEGADTQETMGLGKVKFFSS